MTSSAYAALAGFLERPEPFSAYTARRLWTDPHISERMLQFHLDPDGEAASRRHSDIPQICGWIDAELNISGKTLCDLGCGPGLYAVDLCRRGALVHGVDFSARSIEAARALSAAAGCRARFEHADYLTVALPQDLDLVLLIYGDACALSPSQRAELFGRVRKSLNPGGAFVLDAFSAGRFASLAEEIEIAPDLMGGFWAQGPYIGLRKTALYPEARLALDRYLILEPDGEREFFNWLQHFEPVELAAELAAAGFEVADPVDAVSGGLWTDETSMFALVARKSG